MGSSSAVFPWLRWAAVAWLTVWAPAYEVVWGWRNFLHVCDAAVILTCLGLWRGNALLLSTQAISSIIGDAAWCVDVGWRLFAGHHLMGGTEYMWDERFPLWVRLLSLFHMFLPVLLVWSLRRVGYDRRALLAQSAIAAILLVASRFVGAVTNINYAFRDPLFQRSWGPAPVHLAVIFLGMVILTYWPVHLILRKVFPSPGQASSKP